MTHDQLVGALSMLDLLIQYSPDRPTHKWLWEHKEDLEEDLFSQNQVKHNYE